MANFFCSAGYPSENVHSGMIAYLCDLWNEGEKEPLSAFLSRLGVQLDTQNDLRVNREWKRIDLVVFDAESGSPVVAIEMKVDSHERLVKGEPQTIAYPKLLPDSKEPPFLFVTLGVGEFYHAPHGKRIRWVCLEDFDEALKAISTDDPFIERWREIISNEVDLQKRCFSSDRSRIKEYRGKTWSLYLLGHLKEKLVESLSGRNVGIDPFVYPYGRGPDTILYFGRSKLPAYLEINNNALLNLKVNVEGLTTKEEKEERVKKAQTYYQGLLRGHNPVLNAKKLYFKVKSWTIMSFDVGLVRQDDNLFYLLPETDIVNRLSQILETFYGNPPFDQIEMDPSLHPPHY